MQDPITTPIQKKGLGTVILILILILLLIGVAVLSYQHQSIKKLLEKKQHSDIEQIVYKNKIIQSEPKVIEKIVYKDKLIPAKPKIVEKIVYKDKLIPAKPKIVEKVVYKDKLIPAKPKIVEKIVYKDKLIPSKPKVIEKVIYDNKHPLNLVDFDVFYCYGMQSKAYRLSKKCQTELPKFLKKRKNFKYFEIIGVINPKELSDQKQTSILIEKGLEKLRVTETIWNIKKELGQNILAVPVTYHVKSDQYQGTIIRAYRQ